MSDAVRDRAPIIDPTENVKALSEAANKRQDDLRDASERFMVAGLSHVKELSELRAYHQREMDIKEAGRLDAIRQIDQAAIRELAVATTTIAEKMRNDLALTAAALAKSNADATLLISDRLSSLEKAQNQGSGKSLVLDKGWAYLVAAILLAVAIWGAFHR